MAAYQVRRAGCPTSSTCRHDILAEFADLDEALDFAEARGGQVIRVADGRCWTVDGWVAPERPECR